MIEKLALGKNVGSIVIVLMGLLAADVTFASVDDKEPAIDKHKDFLPDIKDSVPKVKGVARDPDSGEVVYREFHYCDVESLRCHVHYQDADGVVIVKKLLNYTDHAIAPDLEQLDIRSGRYIVSERDGDVTRIYISQDEPKSDVKEKILLATKSFVVDAGFDNFIRQQWDELLAGNKAKFEFALPSRGAAIKMSANKLVASQCAGLVEVDDFQCFEIVASSWWFSRFLKPIQLAYDSRSRKLLAFKGLSSIKDNDDKAQSVLISYLYPEQFTSLPSQ